MAISLINKVVRHIKGFNKTTQGAVTTGSNDVFDLYAQSRSVPKSAPACLAPFTSISFNLDGSANVCCLNKKTTVYIQDGSIDDIWKSKEFELLRKNVVENNLEYDCGACHSQILAGNYAGVKAADYDNYYPYNIERPQFMEFCLENTCNLACKMCNSLLSSTIRTKENLPPLKKHYDDKFVTQLEPYIPHLKEVAFAGGEPFLIPLYYKMWEKMLDLNPNLLIGIVTNGSVLNEKIRTLLNRGRFRINISIDSADKQTYEAIRRNGNFEHLMENFNWFKEYGERVNLPINIPICPLTDNWSTIPQTVRFANQHNVTLNFVYVYRPFAMALANCKAAYLENIIAQFSSEKFESLSPRAAANISRFNGLLEEIKKWRDNNLQLEQTVHHSNLMQMLQTKIEVWGAEKTAAERDTMFEKINEMFNAIPPQNHEVAIRFFGGYSAQSLGEFLETKNNKEIAVFFRELVGAE